MRVPMLDLKEQYQAMREEMLGAIDGVMTSANLILGENVKRLEGDVARLSNVAHGIGCANGSDAIHIALQAAGVRPGDEIITTPFTFFATGGAIVRAGAKPVFVDIDPVTYQIDAGLIEEAITERTTGILPVHLYGQMGQMDVIAELARKYGLIVVEDAAQAIGATYKGKAVGEYGTAATYSFFPTKNLGGYGDGGMIVTNEDDLAQKARVIRVHGSKPKYYHHVMGYNSRLDEMQAAILNVKFPHLSEWTQARRAHADYYTKMLKREVHDEVVTPVEARGAYHVYHQYTIRVPNRDELQAYLASQGIQTMIYYPLPLHLQPVFSELGYKQGSLVETEKAAEEVISLPMFPELHKDQQEYVVEKIVEFYKGDVS